MNGAGKAANTESGSQPGFLLCGVSGHICAKHYEVFRDMPHSPTEEMP